MANLFEAFGTMPDWLIAAYKASESQYYTEENLAKEKVVQIRDAAQKHMTPAQENNTVRTSPIKLDQKRLDAFKQKYHVDATFLFNSYLYRLLNGMPVIENHHKEIQLPRKVQLGSENILPVERNTKEWDAATSESLQGQATYKRDGGQTDVKDARQIQKYVQSVVVPDAYKEMTLDEISLDMRVEYRGKHGLTVLTPDYDYTFEVEKSTTGDNHKKQKIQFVINPDALKEMHVTFSPRNPLYVVCKTTAVTNIHEARRNNFRNTLFFINRATEDTAIKVDVRYWDNHIDQATGKYDPQLHIMSNDISGEYVYQYTSGNTTQPIRILVGNTGMHRNFKIQDICMIQFDENNMILPENLEEDVNLDEADIYDYQDEANKVLNPRVAKQYGNALNRAKMISVFLRNPSNYTGIEKYQDDFNLIVDQLHSIALALKDAVKSNQVKSLSTLTGTISNVASKADDLYQTIKSNKAQTVSWDEEIINQILNS